jgi:hypothetical protein
MVQVLDALGGGCRNDGRGLLKECIVMQILDLHPQNSIGSEAHARNHTKPIKSSKKKQRSSALPSIFYISYTGTSSHTRVPSIYDISSRRPLSANKYKQANPCPHIYQLQAVPQTKEIEINSKMVVYYKTNSQQRALSFGVSSFISL